MDRVGRTPDQRRRFYEHELAGPANCGSVFDEAWSTLESEKKPSPELIFSILRIVELCSYNEGFKTQRAYVENGGRPSGSLSEVVDINGVSWVAAPTYRCATP